MTKRWWMALAAVGALMAPPAAAQMETPELGEQGQIEAQGQQCRAGGEILEFAQDSAELTSAAKSSLEGAKTWLEGQDEQAKIRVEGFSSPSGPAAYNQELSRRRAESARQHLIAQGIAPHRISAVGRGEQPSMPDGGPGRRTVVVLYCQGDAQMAATTPEFGEDEAGIREDPLAQAPTEVEPTERPLEEPVTEGPVTEDPLAEETEVPPAAGVPGQDPMAQDPTAVEPGTEAQEPLAEEFPPIDEPVSPAPYQPPPTEGVMATLPESRMSEFGIGVSIGGGILGFTDQEARDLTDIGASWEARVAFGTQLPVGLEVAYVGSAQPIEAATLGMVDDEVALVGNGAELALRLQLPTFLVQPYALAGLGWTYYSLSGQEGSPGPLQENDHVLTVPLGVGISFRAPLGATFDLRGLWRPAFGADLMSGVYEGTGRSAAFDTWAANGRLGWTF